MIAIGSLLVLVACSLIVTRVAMLVIRYPSTQPDPNDSSRTDDASENRASTTRQGCPRSPDRSRTSTS